MTISAFPPGLALILGAFLLPFFSGTWRRALILGLPLLTLWLIWQVGDGEALTLSFLDQEIVPVKGDALSRLFATIFSIMAFAGGLFGMNNKRPLEMSAAFAYAGAAIGVTFSGDLITLFVFWEIMALGSTMVIWSASTEASYKCSMRYLMVHLLGGVLLMAGILAHLLETGSIAFTQMTPGSIGTWLILIGFLLFLQGLKREIVQDVFDCLTQQRDPESLSVDRLEADIRKAPQSRAE